MAEDHFYSSKVRIARAEEHLKDLNTQIDSYFAKEPYAKVVDLDADGIHEIHKIKLIERFPLRWRLLATEIVEHLRASLDHATWTTGYLKSGDPNIQQVHFPFAGAAAGLENSMRRRSKNLPPEIQTLLRAFAPYKGGNHDLYDLNDLCNMSKHALIAFVGCITHNIEITGFDRTAWDREVAFFRPPIWNRAENEIPYARVARGANFEHDLQFRLYVSLDYRELTNTEPATAVLDAYCREVHRVVWAIEAESRRIGLIT
jgi:hypothetical protein